MNSLLSPKAPNYGPDYWKKLLIGGIPFPGADKAFLKTRQLFCWFLEMLLYKAFHLFGKFAAQLV